MQGLVYWSTGNWCWGVGHGHCGTGLVVSAGVGAGAGGGAVLRAGERSMEVGPGLGGGKTRSGRAWCGERAGCT